MSINRFLTISGVLPFLIILVLSLFKIYPNLFDYQFMIFTYSAIIISFISGSHWGIVIDVPDRKRIKIESNIITLIAWLCVLVDSIHTLIVLIFCFIYLQYIDIRLKKQVYVGAEFDINKHYYQSRLVATLFVVIILFIFYLTSLGL
ncbi:MAG: DUF3429 domain-containing protein [Hyphomicrobiales bacterium]|jgi:hypothetical protein|nr:DUF3429 domain-containing protein [Hyphomicrobiales bacterium]|tara:strand:- start:1377 stop:1817 length:441 start_codon:yes stop_codon:yes gene_type:complete